MATIISHYVNDLLDYAKEHDKLEQFYTYALILMQRPDWSNVSIPEDLDSFLQLIHQADIKSVLSQFIDIAGEHLGLLNVTIISAVPLSKHQQEGIENKLVHIFNKHIHMTAKVDPSLLGGLRIIAGYVVIDNTIKSRILDMKKNIYKGVHFK